MGSKLRTPQEALWPCSATAGSSEDPPCHLFEVEAAIESITEGA